MKNCSGSTSVYVGGVKVHEGGVYPEEVEKILRSALE